MVELIRALERLEDDELDRAILRIISEVLIPAWEDAIASLSHDPAAAGRLRAVQRVQNGVASTSRTFHYTPRPLPNSRVDRAERAYVAELCTRAQACCGDPMAQSGVRALNACPITLAPPRMHA